MLSIAERFARRAEARRQALELMALHGLRGWTFAFNRRKRTLGLCCYAAKRIELSLFLIDRNGTEEIRDTILHEIAHALTGPEHGHDAVWRLQAVAVGAKPERCGQADMPEGRWQANCGGCGKQFSRHRRPKRMLGWFRQACGPQSGNLTWQDRGGA